MRWMACFLLIGCTGSNGDFDQAVPDRSQITLDVPGGQPSGTSSSSLSQGLLGQRAQFYEVTVQTTSDFNSGVGGFLANIQSILAQPPSATNDSGHAIWGPTNDPLATSNYRFEVQKTDVGYNYAFSAKLKSEPDTAWQMVVQGATHRVDAAHALGEIDVNTLLAKHYDDTTKGDQNYKIHFDSTADPRVIDISFDQGGAVDAMYHYSQSNDGYGTFQFVSPQDVDGDGTLEQLSIVSRWLPTGAGRADVVAQGGSLAAPMNMTECWDAAFGRTFFAQNGNTVEGDPASCAY